MTQSVETERSIGQLVADTKGDVTDVVRTTVELGKAEVGRDVKVIGIAVGMWAAAGFLALYMFGMLLLTLAEVLDTWLWRWAAFASVTGFMILVIAVLALLGLRSFNKKHGKPVTTISHLQDSIATLKASFAAAYASKQDEKAAATAAPTSSATAGGGGNRA